VATKRVILPRWNWDIVLREDEELLDLVMLPIRGAREGERRQSRRERRVAASVERVKISTV
jgi:hypothetical protein